jgi:hypothetical protein
MKGATVADSELTELGERYRRIKREIAEIGFIATGTVIERSTTCGTEGCRCHAEPPSKHGPYFQYTRKIAGKTMTRRLSVEQADRYREWIANRRRLDELIAEMDKTSRRAADLLRAGTSSSG